MKTPEYFPTKYWHKLEDGRVQCDVCPQYCKLKEGQRGLCFVRMRKNDEIVLTTYGRSSGFCIDPVEKKPLYHFLPGTPILSFGTAGCNLGCKFCQNWDISKSREFDTLADEAMPEKLAEVAEQYHCKSIAYTYNDPIVFMEYAIDTAKACHKKGIKSVAVTNGFMCEKSREEFYQYMDAANVDLKGFSEEFYKKITNSRLQPVLDTLEYIKHHTKTWLEITTLLIPGLNDSEKEIEKSTSWILDHLGNDVPLHFTAFFPAYKMTNISPTPIETLQRARDIALNKGLLYVYTGNVIDIPGSTTYCRHCHKAIIERSGFTILNYQLTDNGHCKFCHTLCDGVFEGPAGNWGSKRLPIYLKEE